MYAYHFAVAGREIGAQKKAHPRKVDFSGVSDCVAAYAPHEWEKFIVVVLVEPSALEIIKATIRLSGRINVQQMLLSRVAFWSVFVEGGAAEAWPSCRDFTRTLF
jgi:hypothetical protein